MKRAIPTGRFKKDLKRIRKRGWNVHALEGVVSLLQLSAQLPENAFPHKLSGEYKGNWECHIAPDWLLIYDITEDAVILARTGSHADLFE